MRKQARRLWFGDWRSDEEPALTRQPAAGSDDADTVVIAPDDDGDALPSRDRRNVRPAAVVLVGIALLAALGLALSSGGDAKRLAEEQPQIPAAQTPQAQPQSPQSAPPQGFGGADLTGAAATKAAEAAVAKYPGDVERVTRGPAGGGYVVHVIQPDGNEVHVLVDDQFKVQGSDANSGPRNFGSGTSQ